MSPMVRLAAAMLVPLLLFMAVRRLVGGRRRRILRRRRIVQALRFPPHVVAKAREQIVRDIPGVDEQQMQRVAGALKQFFHARVLAGTQSLGMPSQVADALWHAFILDTRAYARFCGAAFGGYFHHVPAGAERGSAKAALARTWRFCRRQEPGLPAAALPLLFRIDRELGHPLAVDWDAQSFRGESDDGDADCTSGCSGGNDGSSGTTSGGHSHHGHGGSASDGQGASGAWDAGSGGDGGADSAGGDGGSGGDSGGGGCGGSSCSGGGSSD